jgi:hypothetical protein
MTDRLVFPGSSPDLRLTVEIGTDHAVARFEVPDVPEPFVLLIAPGPADAGWVVGPPSGQGEATARWPGALVLFVDAVAAELRRRATPLIVGAAAREGPSTPPD